jgi:hypothetical protein
MKKPKSKAKQLAARKRAAKRNLRDIKIRNSAHSRRLKLEQARANEVHKQKLFLEKLEEAQEKFQDSNGIS